MTKLGFIAILTEPEFEISIKINRSAQIITGLQTPKVKGKKKKVLPRFELGLLDSESNVLTNRP